MVDHSYDPTLDRDDGQGGGSDSGEGDRVAKVLARAGVASRREVEKLIEAGRVAVNGRTLTAPGVKLNPKDIVTVDGEVVGGAEATRLWRYHKPAGLVTTHKDPQGRPTVFDSLPEAMPRVISIGRLDLNSEGLLLLTNDGALARALELPNNGWVRRYRARAHGRTTQETLDTLAKGVTVDGVRYGPIEARLDKAKEGPSGANLWISVALTEGKNREVRKVLESIGLKVNRLIRLSYGPFLLGTLASDGVEEVGPRVIREQLAGLIDPANMPKGDRAPKPGPQAPARRPTTQARAADEAPEKLVRKPGWAKPKKKVNPHVKAGAKPARRGPPKDKVLSTPMDRAAETRAAKPAGKSSAKAGPRPSRPASAARSRRPR